MGDDWFERITGFREEGYAATKRRLAVEGDQLVSLVNAARHGIGSFETPTLDDLRRRASDLLHTGRRSRLRNILGDARQLHADEAWRGATFQVASQFNALEMVSPNVSPEDGVTRYACDMTQGPACAIAVGAATIWRNYFAVVDGQKGQTAQRQIDTLAGTGALLSGLLARPVPSLWTMRNGYALATADGLAAIGRLLQGATDALMQQLRGSLAVAWQRDAEVTDAVRKPGPMVSQVFCSALPVAYSRIPPGDWAPFARLVLEATYEATLLAARLQKVQGGSGTVLLTRVGGGAFGNEDAWIDDALRRALAIAEHADLDIVFVSRGQVHPSFATIVAYWG